MRNPRRRRRVTSSTHCEYSLLDHIYDNISAASHDGNGTLPNACNDESKAGVGLPLYEGWLAAAVDFFCDAAGADFLGVEAAAEAAFDGRPMVFLANGCSE